jgi:hypothetical protein
LTPVLAVRLPIALLLSVICLGVLSQVAASAAAPPARGLVAAPSATTASSKRLAAELASSVRTFRVSAADTVREPDNPFLRIGFTAQRGLLASMIHEVRLAGGREAQAKAAELVLVRESRRVLAAWDAADHKGEVAAVVRQLDALSIDAAHASGARTDAELNAFKKAHLADVRYASRRWLVDRAVGRQGAVIISRGVRNARLRQAVESLYRPGAKIGDGGTADALLAEVRAGCRGRDCTHFLKAAERRASLLRILSEEALSPAERGITGELVGALTKAIRVAGGT